MTLYFAIRNPRTPWLPRLIAGVVVAYAISPIDLIPDFIPVLGYVDDIVIVPLGIWLAVRLIPKDVLKEAELRALAETERPTSNRAALLIIFTWLVAAALCGWWAFNIFLR